MTQRLVVIGADAAGMSAASQARRRRPRDDLAIVAFDRGNFTSYSACGIPYWIAGDVDSREALVARSPEEFHRRYDIETRMRHEVVGIDLAAATVRVRDLDRGVETDESYDQLMVATGATPIRPTIDGIDAHGIFGVQTLDDGSRILDELAAEQPSCAVVVGAGYIGLEMAEAMKRRGLDVQLVEGTSQPMNSLDPDMGATVADAMRSMGITLHLETLVEGFGVEDGRVRAVVTENGSLPADLVVLGIGSRPNVALAADAGLPIGSAGGMVTDFRQRCAFEGVWAAGDCTETFHRVSHRPVAIALGTIANKQGRVAGINLGGDYATFPGVVGTAVTKVCGLEIARTGLMESEAEDAGFEYVTAKVSSTTRAGYFPGTKELTLKLVAERRSGTLLGAQIVGEEGAAKRIDALATALWNEMAVDELLNVDLSYAPPFSPVWDPVLIGARKAWQAVEADIHDRACGQGS